MNPSEGRCCCSPGLTSESITRAPAEMRIETLFRLRLWIAGHGYFWVKLWKISTTAPRKPQRAGGEGPSRFKNLCWRGRRRSPVGSDSGDGREDEGEVIFTRFTCYLTVCHHQVELPDVSISIVPREFHVEPITDFALKLPPGLQFKAMTLWLNQTFSEWIAKRERRWRQWDTLHLLFLQL